jgi:hypothetical protein
MVLERAWVGLDVHARSIVAGVIDGVTGEIRSERLAPTCETVAWGLRLPGSRPTGAMRTGWTGPLPSGLVPSEQSSGGQRVLGPITKTGNTHARRLLVEAAWHHRKPYRPSRALLARQAGQPAVVRQRAERGHLCTVLEPAGHCRSSSLSSRRARRASARATRPALVMV